MGNVLLAISYSQTINIGLMTYMTCDRRICLCTIVVNALVESLRFCNVDQYLVTLGHVVSHIVTIESLRNDNGNDNHRGQPYHFRYGHGKFDLSIITGRAWAYTQITV